VSSKGQIVLPAEIRELDGVEAGQKFDIERIDRGRRKQRLQRYFFEIGYCLGTRNE